MASAMKKSKKVYHLLTLVKLQLEKFARHICQMLNVDQENTEDTMVYAIIFSIQLGELRIHLTQGTYCNFSLDIVQ